MIEQILTRKNMVRAMHQVQKNQGSAGVDRMPVTKLSDLMSIDKAELTQSVRSGKYLPQAILGVEIPKGNGKMRLLGIPTVTDRLLQQAVLQIITAKFEFDFSDSSFGFRPNRSLHQAVLKAQGYINDGYQHIVDIDLKTFFDEVDHCHLLQLLYRKVKCRDTMRLIRKWLRAPILIDGRLVKRRKGVPQGSPLSPLLSNIMLHELDRELEKQGLKFIRYADDFSIYTKLKATARRVGNKVYKFLRNKLKLTINREKSGIRRPVHFTVLGFGFVPTYKKGERGKYQLVVSDKSWKKLKEKLKTITRKTTPMSFEERIQKLKEVQKGWVNNFRMASILVKLQDLDGWIRNRLRYCIWHHWKKPEKKRRSLIRLGVQQGQAYAWSRSRMGGWAIAQSPILRTTITLERLQKRGYESMLDIYKKISPQLNEPLYTRPVRTVV
ncbi:group II intron reverse transcriptase/maturase [Labilibaculum sp. A4]|uniref:group II intron reverse transcriptase/maturase n=1 Tax=Labilibaculum euxinus TaxID=2686357 RepID=UPI000F6262D1|nr:group II intron reverse transcriptase/maturase [Labilibaculum euxinus]MDQ1772007.1 group II intron reverse transcriptase/maturase [Labilibaculum euxinus]MWN75643.1 group II intron reverse transcriptase/maturase [Labilibaculum euxinus]